MLEVRVKGPAIKLQGQWKFKGETAKIEQKEYDENKDYLEVIKGEVKQNNNIQKNAINNQNNNNGPTLTELREKAKDLGIKGANKMGKEELITKIEEAEKTDELEEEQSEENEILDEQEGEDQPQE